MSDLCNHSSASVLVSRDGRYALADRVKPPLFKAPSAGHVDEMRGVAVGDGPSEERAFRDAAVRELEEEFGLRVRPGDLHLALTVYMANECRRMTVDGKPPGHWWRVYTATIDTRQNVRLAATEAKNLYWYTPDQIRALPDLEPVWRTMLQQMRVI